MVLKNVKLRKKRSKTMLFLPQEAKLMRWNPDKKIGRVVRLGFVTFIMSKLCLQLKQKTLYVNVKSFLF